jgi:signal transduction histidine kinase
LKTNTDFGGFLTGGGEMGELIRNYDWDNSTLGKIENWPLSLRATIGIILHCAFPMFLFWGDELLCFYNDAYRPSLGNDGKHPSIGKKGKEVWPEIWEFIGPIINDVRSTGNSKIFKDQLLPIYRNGNLEDVYWTFTYSPAYNDTGHIAGVFVTCSETTEKVITIQKLTSSNERLVSNEKLLRESKEQLQFAIEAAELGTWELNPQTNKFNGNSRLKDWFGLSPEDEIDLELAVNVISPNDREMVSKAIATALTYESGGRYDIQYTIQSPKTEREILVKAKGQAFFGEDKLPFNFSGTLEDVTEEVSAKLRAEQEAETQRLATLKLQEAELFSRDVFNNSPVAKVVFIGSDMIIERINEKMLDILGRDVSVIGKPFFVAMPELIGTPLGARLDKVFRSGEMYIQPEEKIDLVRFGEAYSGYYNYTYKALTTVTGDIYGVIVSATEVTEQVVSRLVIEQKEKDLRDLIEAAPVGICVVSGEIAWVEEVNERFLLISGKTREQFAKMPYWEALEEVQHIFKPILDEVFVSGQKYTTDEHEMVLIRDGVPEHIFLTFEYIPIIDEKGKVNKVIVLVIEVTHQAELRRTIENAVLLRTKELAETNISLTRSNNELEQFAYIASHDLQEPIRKISTFLEMLKSSLGDISNESENYFTKINTSAARMTKLIRDVLAFSQVSQNSDSFAKVDLNEIMTTIQTDFELLIEQKQATIETVNLPVIDGVQSQMLQLFSNLMSNALKFTKENVKPVIRIVGSIAPDKKVATHPQLPSDKKYYLIEFSDNGTGFDQEYADRIFKIFQRLHDKNDYEGTGIGLSICRKIVQSHDGHISATSMGNGGAKFNILLPV